MTSNRRRFLAYFAGLGLTSPLFPGLLWAQWNEQKTLRITKEILRTAAEVAGLTFTEPELDAMLDGVNRNLSRYEELRNIPLDNNVAPPLYFNPLLPGMRIDRSAQPFRASRPPRMRRPHNLGEIARRPKEQTGPAIATH
jgi:hypothetical protein